MRKVFVGSDSACQAFSDEPFCRGLRCRFLRSPLLLPTLAVLGVLGGGMWWMLSLAAILLAGVTGLYRILLMSLLCALLAALQLTDWKEASAALQKELAEKDAVTLTGTVERELSRGCILATKTGERAVIRGEIPWKMGDIIRVTGSYLPVKSPPVKGMFDAASWLESRGAAAQLAYVRGEWLGHPFSWASFLGRAQECRRFLAARLMPPGTEADERRQVLCALVLGDKTQAEEETLTVFRRGGCLHAFAVSGLHVGLVAGLVWLLLRHLRFLRLRPRVARLVLLLTVALYVWMTGAEVPAQRAFLMLAVVVGGQMLLRPVSLLNTLCFAALVILLPQPWQLHHAGFQLSFAVYLAICAGARLSLRDHAWCGPDHYIPSRILSEGELRWMRVELGVRGVVVVSLCAWLASLLVTMVQFHAFNSYSFLTNMALSPLLPLVMGAGMLWLAVGWIPVLGTLAGKLALTTSGWMVSIVSFFAALPGSYLPDVPPAPPESAMIFTTGYGGSICVLGNPGLVVDTGTEATARFQTEPALFHAGYSPALALISRSTRSADGGLNLFRRTWPRMGVIRASELGKGICSFRTEAGEFRLYPPPPELPRSPSANEVPIISWTRGAQRLLYIGDASWETFAAMPPEERRAGTLILGYSPRQPIEDVEELLQTGASRVILLPSAGKSSLPEALPASVECVQLSSDEDDHMLSL